MSQRTVPWRESSRAGSKSGSEMGRAPMAPVLPSSGAGTAFSRQVAEASSGEGHEGVESSRETTVRLFSENARRLFGILSGPPL